MKRKTKARYYLIIILICLLLFPAHVSAQMYYLDFDDLDAIQIKLNDHFWFPKKIYEQIEIPRYSEIHDWSNVEKEEFIRLLNNLHRNVNKECPELNLNEDVQWNEDLVFVSKVKLKYQYEECINDGEFIPHIYHQRPEPYNELIPKMKNRFLDLGNNRLTVGDPPYFFLENEYQVISTYPWISPQDPNCDIDVYGIISGYLIEEYNPSGSVGHATALLGCDEFGSAYNLSNSQNSDYPYAFHEINSYKGNTVLRSINNDYKLKEYAQKNLYRNPEKVRDLLQDPVEILKDDMVSQQFDAIGNTFSYEKYDEIIKARVEYDKLTPEEKSRVKNYETFLEVEKKAKFWSMGDISCDGKIDSSDLTQILSGYGTENPAYDIDRNGIVDAQDLSTILTNYGAVL